jgi:hypothetical protein
MAPLDPAAPGGPFARLAQALGMTDPAADVNDEHWRWHVYQEAIASAAHWELLLEATEAEPEIPLPVVLEMLERVADADAPRWVAALGDRDPARAFAQARAADMATSRRLAVTDATTSDAVVQGWSDWLQRRVAHHTESAEVLRVLEAHGRTRRVRGAAREGLIAIRRGTGRQRNR